MQSTGHAYPSIQRHRFAPAAAALVLMALPGCPGVITSANTDGSGLPAMADLGGNDLLESCTPVAHPTIECSSEPAAPYNGGPRRTGHRGCDFVHDVCADGHPPGGGNDFWFKDRGEQISEGHDVIVLGHSFDAIKYPGTNGPIVVYEYKTWSWKFSNPSLKALKIQRVIGQMKDDLAIAKACGFTYIFNVANPDMYWDLANHPSLPRDPSFILNHAFGCDYTSDPNQDPDP